MENIKQNIQLNCVLNKPFSPQCYENIFPKSFQHNVQHETALFSFPSLSLFTFISYENNTCKNSHTYYCKIIKINLQKTEVAGRHVQQILLIVPTF